MRCGNHDDVSMTLVLIRRKFNLSTELEEHVHNNNWSYI